MNRLMRNTAAVLVLTLFTGLAVFAAVQLGDRLFGTSPANAQTAAARSATLQGGSEAQGSGQSGAGGGTGLGQGAGGGSGSSAGQSNTCPATGCSASTCHATQ